MLPDHRGMALRGIVVPEMVLAQVGGSDSPIRPYKVGAFCSKSSLHPTPPLYGELGECSLPGLLTTKLERECGPV